MGPDLQELEEGLAVIVMGGVHDGREGEIVNRGTPWGTVVVRFADGSEAELEEGVRTGVAPPGTVDHSGIYDPGAPPGWWT